VNQTNKPETLNDIQAKRIMDVLMDEIKTIRSVEEWSNKAKVPVRTQHRIISDRYGKTPSQILMEVKYEKGYSDLASRCNGSCILCCPGRGL
jgi:AraC-like DNA-binding protein